MKSLGLLLGTAAAALSPAAPQVGDLVRMPEADWEQRPGAELPLDAPLRDEHGGETSLGAVLAGGPAILALVYYECPMLCNLVLDGLLAGLVPLPFEAGDTYRVVAVSIDPGEGPELAAAKRDAYARAYELGRREAGQEADQGSKGKGDGPGWRFLVGSEDSVRSIADAVGFRYTYVAETDEYAHPAGVAVLTAGGTVSRTLFGHAFEPRDLRLALVDAGEGRVGSLADKVLLRCFHYDPARGRYGFAILGSLRAAGIVTVLLLALCVARALLRDRARTS